VPRQALLQQTLSAQKLDKQSLGTAHVEPGSSLQVLAPLQEPLAHSLSGSVAVMIGPHVPLVPWPFFTALQASHVPTQALLQQTLSTQKLDKHAALPAHVAPRSNRHVLAPLHDPFAHSLSGSVAVMIGPHVPSVPWPFFNAVHASHVPAQALLQQTLSTQKLDKHAELPAHVAPISNLHALAPLHDPLTHSLAGSVAVMIGPHVPSVPWPLIAAVHASHVPAQALLQQTLSAQKPDKHAALPAHVAPRSSLQVLAPLHDPLTHSLSGSVAVMIGPHVPLVPWPFFAAVHASHVPMQALLQQTLSTQKLDKQSLGTAHVEPGSS
jgi:cytochrome c-type biogenesis protein CcmH/NrfG